MRQLCAAGGSSCSAAGLRLARALLMLPVQAGARRHALDALLVLLVRAEKTRDCIAEVIIFLISFFFVLIKRRRFRIM